jgi:hypothetical protein
MTIEETLGFIDIDEFVAQYVPKAEVSLLNFEQKAKKITPNEREFGIDLEAMEEEE